MYFELMMVGMQSPQTVHHNFLGTPSNHGNVFPKIYSIIEF